SLICLFTLSAAPVLGPLSLHDALPICHKLNLPSWDRWGRAGGLLGGVARPDSFTCGRGSGICPITGRLGSRVRRSCGRSSLRGRSEEHTSELQSRENLVCRLLLEKKNR